MPFETDFLITHETSLSVNEFLNHIENKLKNQNIKIFVRINHAEEARNVGLTLQDEEVIIFGNPVVGTHLMAEQPAIGIELPLKIIAWKDVNSNKTKIAYYNLEKMADIFQIKKNKEIIDKLNLLLDGLVKI